MCKKNMIIAFVFSAIVLCGTACNKAEEPNTVTDVAEIETTSSITEVEMTDDTEASETDTEASETDTEASETELVTETSDEKYSSAWGSYITEDFLTTLSSDIMTITMDKMDSSVDFADTYFSDVTMDGVPEFVVSLEGIEHDSYVQVYTISDNTVSLLYETKRLYGVYDIDGVTHCIGITGVDADTWNIVDLNDSSVLSTATSAAYEYNPDNWDSYERFKVLIADVNNYLDNYTKVSTESEVVTFDFRSVNVGAESETVMSDYITAILEK